jgi:hypothetical protein
MLGFSYRTAIIKATTFIDARVLDQQHNQNRHHSQRQHPTKISFFCGGPQQSMIQCARRLMHVTQPDQVKVVLTNYCFQLVPAQESSVAEVLTDSKSLLLPLSIAHTSQN